MLSLPLKRSASACAVLALACALIAIFAWGVIGKHQLDHDARLVYKATRAVTSDDVPSVDATLACCLTLEPAPPRVHWEPVRSVRSRARRVDAHRFSPSRAPPAA